MRRGQRLSLRWWSSLIAISKLLVSEALLLLPLAYHSFFTHWPQQFMSELLKGNSSWGKSSYRNWLWLLLMEECPLNGELVQWGHSGGVGADESDIRSNSHIHKTVWDGHLHSVNLTWKDNHQKTMVHLHILVTFFFFYYKALSMENVEWTISESQANNWHVVGDFLTNYRVKIFSSYVVVS